MKIEKLQVGQVVYSVVRQKMGNTTVSSTSVFKVQILEIDPDKKWIVASWNGNAPRKYFGRSISRWRRNKPLLVTSLMGRSRLATREEIKAKKLKDENAKQGT